MDTATEAAAARILARCAILGAISDEPGRLTRRVLGDGMRRATAQVGAWMRAAGMETRQDTIGNLIARYPAGAAPARTLLLGSHLDTVRDAGRYDGPLGVLVALAAVEELAADGRRLPYALEVVAFADEEGLRYGTAYLGSRVFTGAFDPALFALTDADGVSLAAAIRVAGGDPAALPGDRRAADDLLGYCEVHIEQGPVLEAHGLPVGVVTAIAGQTRARVSFTGQAGHAGTVPMAGRRDALAAAAAFVLSVEAAARAEPGLVATVGQLDVAPGAPNVIPGAATLSLDVRHPVDAVRAAACAALREQAAAIGAARQIDVSWEVRQDSAAVACDPGLQRRLVAAVAGRSLPVLELASGAGHDAAVLAAVTPAALLFVRCAGGLSHHPAESVAAADVAIALAVLRDFLEAWPA